MSGQRCLKQTVRLSCRIRKTGRRDFGPATLLIRHANREQMLEAARNLEGHLTATIHGTEEDLRSFGDPAADSRTRLGGW